MICVLIAKNYPCIDVETALQTLKASKWQSQNAMLYTLLYI